MKVTGDGRVQTHEVDAVIEPPAAAKIEPRAEPRTDTEAAWRRALAAKPRLGAPAGAGAQRSALGGQAALFGPGLSSKKTTAKSLFADVGAALAPLGPDATADDLRAALGGLGFGRGRIDEGWVRFSRGRAEVALRPFSIGGLPAAELAVSAPGKSKKKKAKTRRGVFFQGVTFSEKHWTSLQDRYAEEISRFARAVRADAGPLPEGFDALKTFLERGMRPAELAKRADRAAELEAGTDRIAAQLARMQADGTAPKGVVVYVAGPDAAGKSSTGGIVMSALEKAGFDLGTAVFKAPSAEERAQHWLARFERGVPAQGQAVFWDRGPAGDSVYGPADDARATEMGAEMSAFEADLRARGILMVKVELSADAEKQAATFGKRLARQHIAGKLEAALAAQDGLHEEAKAGLEEISGKLDRADFAAFTAFDEVQAKFLRFVDASSDVEPWLVIDATKRHAARLELIDGFAAALDRFAAR